MKTLAVAAMLAAATLAWAGQTAMAPEQTLMVCLDPGGNAAVIDGGRAAATRVFKHVGIRLDWRNTERPCLAGNGIVVTVAFNIPKDQHLGALGYAMPYERTHIVLMYDRILEAVRPPAVPSLMGYALAHEISHMLEGVSRHSDSGVMKPHWDYRDYADMQLGRLRFTDGDIDLMREGLRHTTQNAAAK